MLQPHKPWFVDIQTFAHSFCLSAYLTAAKVTAPARVDAVAGDPAHLRCNITMEADESVHQVRWHDPHSNMILAYLPTSPVRIVHQDANLKVTVARKDSSYITIEKVRPDDEGCFHCFFDVYPSGKQQGTTCITITGGCRKTSTSPPCLTCFLCTLFNSSYLRKYAASLPDISTLFKVYLLRPCNFFD